MSNGTATASAAADGDVKDNEPQERRRRLQHGLRRCEGQERRRNRDNKDQSGNNRDFDDLFDFDDADMSHNYGAIANQGVQQNLEGGGFQLNSQQNANIYSYGDAYGDYSFNNYNEGDGGDGGDGVDGGNGGDGRRRPHRRWRRRLLRSVRSPEDGRGLP